MKRDVYLQYKNICEDTYRYESIMLASESNISCNVWSCHSLSSRKGQREDCLRALNSQRANKNRREASSYTQRWVTAHGDWKQCVIQVAACVLEKRKRERCSPPNSSILKLPELCKSLFWYQLPLLKKWTPEHKLMLTFIHLTTQDVITRSEIVFGNFKQVHTIQLKAFQFLPSAQEC